MAMISTLERANQNYFWKKCEVTTTQWDGKTNVETTHPGKFLFFHASTERAVPMVVIIGDDDRIYLTPADTLKFI